MDDDLAKRRLWLLTLVRLAGFAPFLFGLAVIYTDLLRPGGWPQLGAIFCIIGVLTPLAITFALRKKWCRERP